jgi:2'-5' RNA ligase
MTPLPAAFQDRWRERRDAPASLGTVYWHVLLGTQPQVRDIASRAQQRLAPFTGLHLTPLQWLHMTVLVAGSTDEISDDDISEMLAKAELSLTGTQPVTVSLGRILYHPEAIILDVQPANALRPLLDAADAATRAVLGRPGTIDSGMPSWAPHVTLCYSTDRQPTRPIISALGKRLPTCEVTIDALHLIIQRGPERIWDWHPVGAARLRNER